MSAASSSATSAAASATPVLSKPHPSHPLIQEGQQVVAQCTIGGIPTTIISTSFVDRIFLCVTQLNKLGSITLAASHTPPISAADAAPTYSITSLLGVRAPFTQLLARRVIEGISTSAEEHMRKKSLLLSIGMKKVQGLNLSTASETSTLTDVELQTIREIVAEVEKIKQW